MSLESDFAQLYRVIGTEVGARGAAFVRAVYQRLVELSPVDTGRFSSNWKLGVDQPDTATTQDTTPPAIHVPPLVLGRVYYLTNSLPYAQRLEHGWSKQAPQGIVSIVAVEAVHGALQVVEGESGV